MNGGQVRRAKLTEQPRDVKSDGRKCFRGSYTLTPDKAPEASSGNSLINNNNNDNNNTHNNDNNDNNGNGSNNRNSYNDNDKIVIMLLRTLLCLNQPCATTILFLSVSVCH